MPKTLPESIRRFCRRLQGVIVEDRPALDLIRMWDAPDALFYCDPPYAPDARSMRVTYGHEMTMGDHADLLDALTACEGMVVLSGYRCSLYDERLRGWERTEARTCVYMGARSERREMVWRNRRALRNCVAPALAL